MARTMGKGGVDDYEQTITGTRDIWAHLQEPEADLAVFHVPAHKASTPLGNQEADVLAKIYTLATDPSVDMQIGYTGQVGTVVPKMDGTYLRRQGYL